MFQKSRWISQRTENLCQPRASRPLVTHQQGRTPLLRRTPEFCDIFYYTMDASEKLEMAKTLPGEDDR